MGRDSLSYGWLCLNPRKWGLDKCLCVGFTPSKRLTCSQGKDHDFGRPEIVFVGARYACAISVALFLKREKHTPGVKRGKGEGGICAGFYVLRGTCAERTGSRHGNQVHVRSALGIASSTIYNSCSAYG